MMKSVLVRLINLDMAHTPTSQVEKVWVRKNETIHPLRERGLWFLNPTAYQVHLHYIFYIVISCACNGTIFFIPRFSLGCFENFLQVHSRDDRESMSLFFCLGIVKPLSLMTGLLLPTCFV
jgi:hypothetical protein